MKGFIFLFALTLSNASFALDEKKAGAKPMPKCSTPKTSVMVKPTSK